LGSLRSYVGVGLKYHNTNIKPAINPDLKENLFRFRTYDNSDLELYAQYDYNSMERVLFSKQGALFKAYVGRSLYGNLELEFTDNDIPNYKGKTKGFSRFGIDYEKRFRITQRLTTILGASSHFTLGDPNVDEA